MPGILWGWVVTTMFTRPGQPVVASSTFQVGPPVGLGSPLYSASVPSDLRGANHAIHHDLAGIKTRVT